MNIGKLKLESNGLISSELDFYEYARHSLQWSATSTMSLLDSIKTNDFTNDITHTQTINMYVQLIAAYSASYWYYLYMSGIIPEDLATPTMTELNRGLNDGINAFTINNSKIDDYAIKLYQNCFHRYLKEGIIKDHSSSNEVDPLVFNPDIDNFTKLFIDDCKLLSERDNNIVIDELKAYYLGQIIADIPLTVFETLSQLPVEYIPPKKGLFD